MRNNKYIFTMLLAQIIIIIFFSSLVYESKPINPQKVQKITINVDDIEYIGVTHLTRFSVICDSVKYRFSLGQCSVNDLKENIEIGNTISISYVTKRNIFGKYNLIVDACTDNKVYYTIEEYNSQKEVVLIISIVICAITESIFLFVVIFRKIIFIGYNYE